MSHLRSVRALVRHKRASVVIFSIAALCAAWASTWRPMAQNQNLQAPNAIKRLGPNAPAPPVDPADRGATYQWLDERAVRVTTTFVDAVAVTERVAGGDLKTRLSDAAGRDLADFEVDRIATGNDVLTFKRGAEHVVRVSGRPGVPSTLDWSNRQAYLMWKDKAAESDVALEWQADLIRARGGAAVDVHRNTVDVRTEWPEGLTARAARSVGPRPHPKTGAPSRGTSMESRLTRDNVEVGRSRWYPEEQVYVWSVPGLTTGYMDADRLTDIGGWTFAPDLAWTNLQTYAFHYFHSLIATQGFVAGARPAARPWLARLADAVAPTLHANEAGCDGLHWLDRTIFRACCDLHDQCYAKNDCDYRSWWEWWSGWKCLGCNITATLCFVSVYAPYSPSYP